MHQYRLVANLLEMSSVKKDLVNLLETDWPRARSVPLYSRMPVGCIKKNMAYMMIFPLYCALLRPHLEYWNIYWSISPLRKG